MASEFIGVLRDPTNNALLMTIKPDDDAELDNPAWLTVAIRYYPDRVPQMVKIPRTAYDALTDWTQLSALVLLYAS